MCKKIKFPATLEQAIEMSAYLDKCGGADEKKLQKRCVKEGKDRKTVLLEYGPPSEWAD